MTKYIVWLVMVFGAGIAGCEEPSDQPRDFFRCLFTDSESGYVFFGTKPVCYFGCESRPSVDLAGSSLHEQGALLREGVEWWKRAEPSHLKDDFRLKIKKHGEIYEILSLNKKQILRVVEENLALFRYVLGPKASPETVFTALAYSDEPFYKILKNNNVLAGILLGFGTENSLLGARAETLRDFECTSSEIPYTGFFRQSPEGVLNLLEFSLIFKDNRTPCERWSKNLGIDSYDEEVQFIQDLEEPSSHLLSRYPPRFIFGGYKIQNNNDALIATREKEQSQIIELLKADNFLERVLSQLNLVYQEKPVHKQNLTSEVLANAIVGVSQKRWLNDLEGIREGVEDAEKEDRYPDPGIDSLYERLVIEQLEKNARKTESYFTSLNADPAFQKMSDSVYIKDLSESAGNEGEGLTKNHSQVVLSYAAYLPLEDSAIPVKAASHAAIDLNEVIYGLAEGLQGMKLGNSREIHVAPESAYSLADFDTFAPLKFVVRLESIQEGSPLVLKKPEISLDRPLALSLKEREELKQFKKAASYHLAKSLWKFFKTEASFSSQELSEKIEKVWGSPGPVDASLDSAARAIYAKKHQDEKDRMKQVLNKRPVQELIPDLAYIEYEKKGEINPSWPKSLSLNIKNLNGDSLERYSYKELNENEWVRFSKGLKEGVKNLKKGDKGTLWIDPDAADQGLFRNKLAHQALKMEFEVF